MMATVPHVTACAGSTKYQADGFLFGRVYKVAHHFTETYNLCVSTFHIHQSFTLFGLYYL